MRHTLTLMQTAIISLVASALVAGFLVFTLALPAYAQQQGRGIIEGGLDNISDEFTRGGGLVSEDPQRIAARIINIFLAFLGLVALVIILLGGFRWMTAQGNEDKVEEAKKILTAGLIGLIIIVSAWAIANYLIRKFLEQGVIR